MENEEKGFEGFLPAIKNSGQVFDPTTPFTLDDLHEWFVKEMNKPRKLPEWHVLMTEQLANHLTCEEIKGMVAINNLVVTGGTKGLAAFYKRMEECGIKLDNGKSTI